MNKPVAWTSKYCLEMIKHDEKAIMWFVPDLPTDIPLYTHPVKELHLSLQKSQEGELLAVTYTNDEHRIVEVLWERPPVKELTDEEIKEVITEHEWYSWTLEQFARAILRKAQEK